MEKQFQNFEENAFLSVDTKTKSYAAIINRAVSGVFKLSLFACYQFIRGIKSDDLDHNKLMALLPATKYGTVSLTIPRLIADLSIYVADLQTMDEAARKNHMISLQRDQVEILRILLEARMTHCEHERDSKDEEVKRRFNVETYISQKLLLLDIREWLTCYSIELGKEVEPAVVSSN